MHDETYKKLFAFPRMVEDLLRGFVPGPGPDEIDFSTLQKLSAEFVSADLSRRHRDTVWQVRLHRRGRWPQLVLLLEFQSRDEPRMALRILTYTVLLYEEMIRNRAVAAGDPLPHVLPVVLYNGDRPWRAAREMRELIAAAGPEELTPYRPAHRYCVVDERHLVQDDLPKSRSVADLAYAAKLLPPLLGRPEDAQLRQVFAEWLVRLALRLAPAGTDPLPPGTLEEVTMSLEERVAEWPKQWLQEGIEQGLAHERAVLRRQAALRFGEEVAARVSLAVERIAEPERLAAAGDWIVRADGGEELVARLMQLADASQAGSA